MVGEGQVERGERKEESILTFIFLMQGIELSKGILLHKNGHLQVEVHTNAD